MGSCTSCGHQLGDGRFCTSCGAPVDRTTGPAPTAAGPETPGDVGHAPPSSLARSSQRVLPWLLAMAALMGVAALGAWLLFSSPDTPSTATEPRTGEPDRSPPVGSPPPDPSSPASAPEAGPGPDPRASRGAPVELASRAAVSAPTPAPPSRDTGGNTVRYVAGNLVDGRPTTAWRMRGDGTGETIRFRFDQPVELRRVGLVNGYAKTGAAPRGAAIDWYSSNRRTSSVEWAFDDGSAVTQDLRTTRRMQTMRVDRPVTRTVTLRLIRVTAPGQGSTGRDYTALSEVHLTGWTR